MLALSAAGRPWCTSTPCSCYEVLAGGYFLVHHVEVAIGTNEVRAIEIIGEPDPEGGGYLARSFDNTGYAEVMQLMVDDQGVFISSVVST